MKIAAAFLALGLTIAAPSAGAQTTSSNALPAVRRETIPAPAQPGTVPLPTGKGADREVWHLDNGQMSVRNVTHPTLTPFLPVGSSSGAARSGPTTT